MLSMDIISFKQLEGESFYELWERFKGLIRKCPHHGLTNWLIVQTFYIGLVYATKQNTNATTVGTLMGKLAEEAQNLVEEMTINSYQLANITGNVRCTRPVEE